MYDEPPMYTTPPSSPEYEVMSTTAHSLVENGVRLEMENEVKTESGDDPPAVEPLVVALLG
jgi:hypothetical protein